MSQISDEVATVHNVRPYARGSAMAFVEARATMAPGCVGTESLIKFEVSAPMKGSPDMGEGERSHRNLRKDLRPELGPGSPIDYAKL